MTVRRRILLATLVVSLVGALFMIVVVSPSSSGNSEPKVSFGHSIYTNGTKRTLNLWVTNSDMCSVGFYDASIQVMTQGSRMLGASPIVATRIAPGECFSVQLELPPAGEVPSEGTRLRFYSYTMRYTLSCRLRQWLSRLPLVGRIDHAPPFGGIMGRPFDE